MFFSKLRKSFNEKSFSIQNVYLTMFEVDLDYISEASTNQFEGMEVELEQPVVGCVILM